MGAPSSDAATTNATIKIRPATIEDLETLVLLYEVEIDRSIKDIFFRISLMSSPCLLAHEGDTVVGFLCTFQFAPDVLQITNMLVVPKHRKKGVGRELLERIEATIDDGYAALLVSNSMLYENHDKRPATDFYVQNGFNVIEETQHTKIFTKVLHKCQTRHIAPTTTPARRPQPWLGSSDI